MKILKKVLKHAYQITVYYFIRFRFFSRKKLIFIDLDETICRTEYRNHSLEHSVKNENYSVINELSKDKVRIILSARAIRHFLLTIKWLNKNTIMYRVCLLSFEPKDKVKLLLKLNGAGFDITFVDDLSYLDNNNEIQVYTELIKILSNSEINYIRVI